MARPHPTILCPICPICQSHRCEATLEDDHPWCYTHLEFECRTCGATFRGKYDLVCIEDVTYGKPLGPPYETTDPQAALAAWEDGSDWQVIRINERQEPPRFAVGYVLQERGYRATDGWSRVSAEDLRFVLERA